MAEKKTEAQKTTPQLTEEVYDASEIAANAKGLFGFHSDLAAAAFKCAGVTRCTLKEAQNVIKQFAERKVQ